MCVGEGWGSRGWDRVVGKKCMYSFSAIFMLYCLSLIELDCVLGS